MDQRDDKGRYRNEVLYRMATVNDGRRRESGSLVIWVVTMNARYLLILVAPIFEGAELPQARSSAFSTAAGSCHRCM